MKVSLSCHDTSILLARVASTNGTTWLEVKEQGEPLSGFFVFGDLTELREFAAKVVAAVAEGPQ